MRRQRRGRWTSTMAAGAVALGLVGAPAPASGAPSPSAAPQDLTISTTQVAFGLQRPTAITAPDDGSGRLFITEKTGTVRVYHPDTGLAEAPLLDIGASVDASGNERGLLGIAASPAFAQDGTLYLAYTRLPDSAVTLARYRLAGDGPVELLTQEHATYANHNGGQLAFGADGHLYWGIGDGGAAGDPFRSGQDLGTLLGKIVRIDVGPTCAATTYCIPGDNPFAGVAGARAEIWSYGLRNPWRFSFDEADGSLWIADVGQGAYEEIDHLRPDQAGANLGWSCREGPDVFDAARCRAGATYVDPVFSYRTSFDGCAVIGGHVYRGARFADIAGGTYVATDYCSNTAWAVRSNPDGTYSHARIGEFPPQVTSFGADANGELYVVNDLPGQLHRVSFGLKTTCAVLYRVQTQWGTGFTTSVTITNNGTAPIQGWSLRWTFPDGQRLTSTWDAKGTQAGTTVTATNETWNPRIDPGKSVTFGFLASRTGANTPPAAFTLNGSTCT